MTTQQRDIPEEPLAELHKHNPGATLQLEREKQGISTASAAATLRLPEKILVHLEAGRFDQLPGDTFARGYVRSYASMLGLDPQRLVLEYDGYVGVVVRERSVSAIDKLTPPNKTGHLLVTWSSVVIALVILASVLVWWYDSQPVQGPAEEISATDELIDEVEVDALSLPGDMAEDVQRQTDAAAEREQLALGADGAGLAIAPDTGAAPMLEDTAPAGADTPPAAPAAEAAVEPAMQSGTSVSASEGLQMRFSANCWLQVTAVGGQVLHSSLMQAGQSLNIDHDGPVDLVIGAVEAVSQIEYRGQPVDMQSYNSAGVVRLRLGQ